jgi:hypothetical protein
MSHTPDGAPAPAPSTHRRRFHFEPRPIDPALRKRRIRLERAINLIGRSKCSVSVALRACGLDHDRDAREDVANLLDRKGIPRIRKGVRPVRLPATPSRVFEQFIPRQEETRGSRLSPSRRALAEMVRELREIADPLGPGSDLSLRNDNADFSVRNEISDLSARTDKPRPPIICASCGDAFEGNRNARFCSGRCRIRSWRAGQR